jgi:hypothetical protein
MSIAPVRAFTLGLAVIAGATNATSATQTDLRFGQLAAAAIPFAACVPGGPTSGDTAIAGQLRPAMNGPPLGGALTAYSISCARAIVQTTRARGLGQRAAVIAVTTAITESSLHNYTQPVDHDSLGLFQQRPRARAPPRNWSTPGTPATRS